MPRKRKIIIAVAFAVLALSLGVQLWLSWQTAQCAANDELYRFGYGCVPPTPPILIERGLQRTEGFGAGPVILLSTAMPALGQSAD